MDIRNQLRTAPREHLFARRIPGALWVSLFVIGCSIPSVFGDEPYSLGDVHTWGSASWGLNAIPEEIESKNVTAVSASVFSLALTDDGQVYVWGDEAPYPYGSAVTPLPEFLSGLRVVTIAAGNKHVLVLTDEGEVYGWGREDTTGRLPVPEPPEWAASGFQAISAGSAHSLALTADSGRIWFWGSLAMGYPVSEMPTGEGFKAIASGGYHCLALTEDGRVVAWGTNNLGQTDVPEELTDGSVRVKKISAGTSHNLALTEDGQIWGWGSDYYGEATKYHQFYGFKDVAAGDQFSVALTNNGTLLAWGWNEKDLAEPPEILTNKDHPDFVPVLAISAGWDHALALTSPKVATPVISTQPFATQVNVTVLCTTEGASIYYTLDGSDPTIEDGTLYSGAFPVAVIEETTFKARAFKAGFRDSDIAEEEIVFEGRAITVSDVEFGNVSVGETGSGQITIRNQGQLPSMIVSVSIDSENEGVFTVYFSSMVPLGVGEEITVNASFAPNGIGLFEGAITVHPDSETRILGDPPTATGTGIPPMPPIIDPESGAWTSPMNVEMEGSTGAELWYRIDEGPWTLYPDDEITIEGAGTVVFSGKAVIGGLESAVVQTVYDLKNPVIRLDPADKLEFGEVGVGSIRSMMFMVYNDGDARLAMHGLLFLDEDMETVEEFRDIEDWSEPIVLEPGESFEFEIVFTPSALGEFKCKIRVDSNATAGDRDLLANGIGIVPPKVATPTIHPDAADGPFTWFVPVTFLTTTEGAVIRYTLDGSDPDAGSIRYDGEFTINSTGRKTVKARALKSGWSASDVAVAEYTIQGIRVGDAFSVDGEEDGVLGLSVDEEGEGQVVGIGQRVLVVPVRITGLGDIIKTGPLISHEDIAPGGTPSWVGAGDHPEAADDAQPEIIGSVGSDGSLTFDIPGIGVFTGSVDSMTGPAAAMAGGYEIDLLYSDSGTCYAVVGSDGTVIIVIETPDGVEGCRGILDSSGHVVMTTSQSGMADLTIGADHSMTLMLTPQGSTEAAEFAGLADGETGTNRLINLSTRGYVGTQSENMIAGFVITGTGKKPVLIRAMGPTLADPAYGVPGVIEDPRIEVKSLDTDLVVATNDDWEDTPELLDAILVTGAFPASGAGSKDAMVLTELDPGRYTAKISGVSAGTGVAIVEVYTVEDLDTPEARQVNISTRGFVGTSGSIMILGLKADGNVPRQFLIRAVGPTLGLEPFNLPGVLTDPVLTVVRSSDGAEVATNDDWDEGASGDAIHALSQQLGAFALPRGSKDAVVLVTLPTTSPFTVKVSGKNGETGVAIAEVYEVP